MTKQNSGENLEGQWRKFLLCYIILTMCRLERKLRGVCGSILIAHIRCFWVLVDLHIKARCKLQNSSILNCAHLVQMAPFAHVHCQRPEQVQMLPPGSRWAVPLLAPSGALVVIMVYQRAAAATFSDFSNSSDSKVKVKVKGPNMCYIFEKHGIQGYRI